MGYQTRKVKLVTPIRLERNISKTAGDAIQQQSLNNQIVCCEAVYGRLSQRQLAFLLCIQNTFYQHVYLCRHPSSHYGQSMNTADTQTNPSIAHSKGLLMRGSFTLVFQRITTTQYCLRRSHCCDLSELAHTRFVNRATGCSAGVSHEGRARLYHPMFIQYGRQHVRSL